MSFAARLHRIKHDAGKPCIFDPSQSDARLLSHLAVITTANLSLTRGLIWLEDVRYDAGKAQREINRRSAFEEPRRSF